MYLLPGVSIWRVTVGQMAIVLYCKKLWFVQKVIDYMLKVREHTETKHILFNFYCSKCLVLKL